MKGTTTTSIEKYQPASTNMSEIKCNCALFGQIRRYLLCPHAQRSTAPQSRQLQAATGTAYTLYKCIY